MYALALILTETGMMAAMIVYQHEILNSFAVLEDDSSC